MGINFNKLWNDPAFIDASQKASIESEVASIGKLMEARESEKLQKKNEDPVKNENIKLVEE